MRQGHHVGRLVLGDDLADLFQGVEVEVVVVEGVLADDEGVLRQDDVLPRVVLGFV